MIAVKGKRNSNEWDHMIIDSDDVCLGVHYFKRMLTAKEKEIIFNHLKLAAEEITSKRLRIEK